MLLCKHVFVHGLSALLLGLVKSFPNLSFGLNLSRRQQWILLCLQKKHITVIMFTFQKRSKVAPQRLTHHMRRVILQSVQSDLLQRLEGH